MVNTMEFQTDTTYQKLNPAELEIDLFCKGIRIHSSCDLENDARDFSRTRAGLGSGLEIIIPAQHKIWMNVPVLEPFAVSSPYILTKVNSHYRLLHEESGHFYDIELPGEPRWYFEKTSSGVRMREIGVLQGTYLGIYVGPKCAFWNVTPQENCLFCATGLNVGETDRAKKTVDEVVETALAAKDESGITFAHINTGFHNYRELELCLPFVKALKEQVGLLVGVQALPAQDYSLYDKLLDMGCDHVSFCFELFNKDYFKRYLPGKDIRFGQDAFFNAMEYTSLLFGKGRISGEIIAGIEPLEDTYKAIDYITGIGAFPTVCIFRPLKGSQMEHASSPSYDDMRDVFQYVYESCMKRDIPIGIAPNIEVSLVVQPTDTTYLAPKTFESYWYQTKLSLMRHAAKPLVRRSMCQHVMQSDIAHCCVDLSHE